MLSRLIENYHLILYLGLFYVFFLKKKYILPAVLNLTILTALLIGVSKVTCLETSVVINILAIVRHNFKFKIYNTLYISIVLSGLLLLAFRTINNELLLNLFNKLPVIIDNQAIVLNELYALITLLMLVGFVPFSESIMHLFMVSNELFKTVFFIIPMTILLFVYRDFSDMFQTISFELLGSIICIYSSICLVFYSNFRAIFSYIIIYFYGLQILLLKYTGSLQFIYLWLSITALMLFLLKTYTPNRALKYSAKHITNIVFINQHYVTVAVLSIVLFILNLLNNMLVFNQNSGTYKYTVFFVILFFFLGKITYSINDKIRFKINVKVKDITNSKFIYLLFAIVFLFYFTVTNIISTCKFFTTPPLIVNIIYISIFCLGYIFGCIFLKISRPKLLTMRTYSNFFIEISHAIKVLYLIIQSALIDFFTTIIKKIENISFSETAAKLSNVLYGNHVYFYIFLLLQIIVILTIECVILQ